jgi:hypothetical protein
MGWFFTDDDDENNDLSAFGDVDSILGHLFGGGLFRTLFDVVDESEYIDPFHKNTDRPSLPQREISFHERIKIIVGDNPEQIDPDSHNYEAHKMRLVFELEDEMLFGNLSKHEKNQKRLERDHFCRDNHLCLKCYEKLEKGICPRCNPTEY